MDITPTPYLTPVNKPADYFKGQLCKTTINAIHLTLL